MEANLTFTTTTDAQLVAYWLGLRVEKETLSNISSLTKKKKGRGMPNHPLLESLSVFLTKQQLDDMNELNQSLQFDDETNGIINNDFNVDIIKQIATLMEQCQYGVWAADSNQLQNELRTIDNVVGTQPLHCHIFTHDEVENILGSRVGSANKLPNAELQKVPLQKGVEKTVSMYADDNFVKMMRSDELKDKPIVLYEYAIAGEEGDESGNGPCINI